MKPHLFTSWIGLLCLVVVLTPCWQTASADEELPQENTWHRVTPSVVWCGDPDSRVTIEVHIVGRSDVAQVQVTNAYEDDRLTLYDDGSHGDATAGDNVFTLSDALLACNQGWVAKEGYSTWMGFLRVRLDDGRELSNNYGIAAGLVDPRYKQAFQVLDFAGGLSATAYAFFIEDSRHEVMDGYPVATLRCGKGNYTAFEKLYSVLPDVFDFVLLMPGMQLLRPDGFGENVPYDVLVSNAVQHIGLPIKDDTEMFGSAGRLKSMVYHSFGSVDIFDHEVAHSWGAGFGASLGLTAEGVQGQGHWDELSDIGGQLGAYYFSQDGKIGHFADNGDGTWRLISNLDVEPYVPLELYLMGLIPPEEVPPMHLLVSPDLSDSQRITAQSARTVTIEEVMTAEGGSRIPTSSQSPKYFTLAFVVTQDLPYNDAAYAYFSVIAHSLMSKDPPVPNDSLAPFYWATGERAILDTRLPVDLAEPPIWSGIEPSGPVETPSSVAVQTSPSVATPATAAVLPTETAPAAPSSEQPAFCSPLLAGAVLVPVLTAAGVRRGRRIRR